MLSGLVDLVISISLVDHLARKAISQGHQLSHLYCIPSNSAFPFRNSLALISIYNCYHSANLLPNVYIDTRCIVCVNYMGSENENEPYQLP